MSPGGGPVAGWMWSPSVGRWPGILLPGDAFLVRAPADVLQSPPSDLVVWMADRSRPVGEVRLIGGEAGGELSGELSGEFSGPTAGDLETAMVTLDARPAAAVDLATEPGPFAPVDGSSVAPSVAPAPVEWGTIVWWPS